MTFKNPIIGIILIVHALIDYERRDWIIDKLEDIFFPEDIALILQTRPVIFKDDYWIWEHNRSGEYSIKSGYWMQDQITNAHLENAF